MSLFEEHERQYPNPKQGRLLEGYVGIIWQGRYALRKMAYAVILAKEDLGMGIAKDMADFNRCFTSKYRVLH